jgi:hypothetical protein
LFHIGWVIIVLVLTWFRLQSFSRNIAAAQERAGGISTGAL